MYVHVNQISVLGAANLSPVTGYKTSISTSFLPSTTQVGRPTIQTITPSQPPFTPAASLDCPPYTCPDCPANPPSDCPGCPSLDDYVLKTDATGGGIKWWWLLVAAAGGIAVGAAGAAAMAKKRP